MKKSTLVAAAALTLVASSAHAEDVTPKYSALPSGRMTMPPAPKKKPAMIGAKETAPGFYPVLQSMGRQSHVMVVGDAESARALRENAPMSDLASSVCFSEGRFEDDGAGSDADWTETLTSQGSVWMKSKDVPDGGVRALHSERFAEKDGNASLEIVDAWIDPATRGARVLDKSSIPLALVGSSARGVRVFAARDDRSDGRRVQLVVVRDETKNVMRTGAMVAVKSFGNGAQSAGCRHLRVSLAVEPKSGDMAIVELPLVLPSLGQKEEKAKETPPNDEKKVGLGPFGIGGRRPFLVRTPDDDTSEARVRSAQIALSVSQTTRDKEPILSVSFGWTGRETVQRGLESPVE